MIIFAFALYGAAISQNSCSDQFNNWILFHEDNSGVQSCLDTSTIEHLENGNVLAWSKDFYEKADEFGNSAIAQLVEFDCKKRRWKEVKIKWFDGERVVYTENQMPPYWWEVTPQIFHGYRRFSLVCFGSNP